MSFTDPIATAIVEIEPVVNTGQFATAAQQAADQFNNRVNQAFARTAARIQNSVKNITAGFQTLGQVIAARLPAQVTTAANAITQRFGQAFGAVQAGLGRLNTGFSSFFGSISTGAAGAAIGLGVLVGIAAKITSSFAETADAFRGAQLGLTAVIDSSDTANITAEELIGNLRELGAALGISSVQLSRSAQQLITLGINGQQTTRILTAITEAGARTGATSAQVGRAFDGLTQIVSKGTLQMEELRRQIAGNLPGALNLGRVFEILGEKMNISAAEVRKLQEQGLITAEQAIPAITQAIEELNGNVDVFALRASTLNGLLAILRENFNQIIGTAFQPFIESLLPTIKGFITAIKEGTGPFASFSSDVQQFGQTMGESLGQILQQVVPLLPKLFHLFTNLTKALAPLVVEIVKIGTTVANILIPVFNVVAVTLDVLLNRIPILSSILKALAAGVITGGVFKAFSLFGRALGSIGGLIGRLATPVSKLAAGLANLAGPVAKIATVIALLNGPLKDVVNVVEAALGKVADLINAIGNIPGIKQAVSAIQAVGGAIGDAFSSDQEQLVRKGKGTLGEYFKTLKRGVQESVSLTNLNKAFTEVLDNTEKLEKAQKAVSDAQKNRTDAIKKERDARQDVVDAIQAETEAKERLTELGEKLSVLEEERRKLLADTTADIREIADAQRDLESTGLKLLDVDAERLDILEKIKELQAPATADEIAAADVKVERATLNLNKAKQEELDLLKELNQETESSVDLTGLTLDQLRTRLAGIRASLAAQRAITKTGRTQEEIQQDLNEAHLNVVDAQISLNEAVQARQELDLQVIQNQSEIERLTRSLKQLELDKAGLLARQIEEQGILNTLKGGETTQAGLIKKVEEEIKNLKIDQKNAVIDVQNATRDIQLKQDAVKAATQGIRDAEREIRQAKLDQNLVTAQILGTERDINNALRDRIGLNGQLGKQTSQLVAQSLINNVLPNLAGIDQVLFEAFVGTDRNNKNFSQKLADMILNNPNKLRDLLRAIGISGFEQGGLITHPQLAMIGEKFKHEMVLPLTKPDRVWDLMSKTLPRYPGALAAAQNAISKPSISRIPKPANLGSKRVVPRADGPATYGQIEELIRVLKEQRTEVHVDAPITVENAGTDQLLLRKLSRQLKREILDELGKRR